MIKKTIITVCTLIFLISNISYADITFWTTEVQPARMAKQEAMAKDFEAKTGIKVEVIPVEEKDLGTRATAAAAAPAMTAARYNGRGNSRRHRQVHAAQRCRAMPADPDRRFPTARESAVTGWRRPTE